MDDFNVVDANAVDHAMLEARAKAEERREKMPTSAAVIEEQARILEVVRDKNRGTAPGRTASPLSEKARE